MCEREREKADDERKLETKKERSRERGRNRDTDRVRVNFELSIRKSFGILVIFVICSVVIDLREEEKPRLL